MQPESESGTFSSSKLLTAYRLLSPRPRSGLVRRDLAQQDVAHLLAGHVEVHEELLAARGDLHAAHEGPLVGAALGETADVKEHPVAARHLLGARLRRRVRRGLCFEALAVKRKGHRDTAHV